MCARVGSAEVESWVGVVFGGLSAAITFATFWMVLSSRITTALVKAKQAEESSLSTMAQAASNMLKQEMLSRELNDFRVTMAGKIASLETTTNSTTIALLHTEDRLAKAIDSLGEKIDKIGESVLKSLAIHHAPKS